MVQLFSRGRDAWQTEPLMLKGAANAGTETLSGPFPLLVTVMGMLGVAAPTATVPKLRIEGVTVAMGALRYSDPRRAAKRASSTPSPFKSLTSTGAPVGALAVTVIGF